VRSMVVDHLSGRLRESPGPPRQPAGPAPVSIFVSNDPIGVKKSQNPNRVGEPAPNLGTLGGTGHPAGCCTTAAT
jgi:hypothetical protein